MRLGVDFGTTRTTVAAATRGNYPIVTFEDGVGDVHEYIPSVAALDGDHLVFGFAAQRLALDGAPHVRSFKRHLSDPAVTTATTIRLAGRDIGVVDLLTKFLTHVAQEVRASSSLSELDPSEPLEAVVGIPAHAHSGQRFLTLEAFRNAGWSVLSMVNEPSAAGFEYTHRHSSTLNSKRTTVLVYDLGGGTFDASLVSAQGRAHEVLASRGHNMLGGDDFDLVLAQCVARAAGRSPKDYGEATWARLIESCRPAKESLNANSRYVTVEVKGQPVTVPVAEFYEAATPLIQATIDTMAPLLAKGPGGSLRLSDDVAGLYVVGGGAELPAVARMLRADHGRRVHRSPHAPASTAIGLAIAADPNAGYTITDTLSRGVGVFRETDSGGQVSFDPLLTPDLRLDHANGASVARRYRAAHNIGWFRFVEYSHTDEGGVPRGDVLPYGEVIIPFDPHLQNETVNLANVPVIRTENGPLVEERYTVDSNGIVEVTITDLETGYTLSVGLGGR